ncbi:MAG: EF-hand domain-containing protein, partial [Muribaculaceae bacterium]|nr:EF-hand domain-containing protein [Muribaculaceae bacterium]
MSINPFGNLPANQDIRLSFRSIDSNNDGKISEEEFKDIANKFDIKFEDFDVNGDLEIDDSEFSMIEELMEAAQEEAIQGENETKSGNGSDYTFDLSIIDKFPPLATGFNFNARWGSIKNDSRDSDFKTAYDAAIKNLEKSSIDGMKEDARKNLGSDRVKNFLKTELTSTLQQKGLSFADVETIFENVYADTVNQTLETEGIFTTTSHSSKGFISRTDLVTSGKCDSKALLTQLILNFNQNMSD